MKKHIKRWGGGRLAHAILILITATATTGCASHRTIMSESIKHDTVISIRHDTMTLIQQKTVRDTVHEKVVLTLVTDTIGNIIREHEVVHHYESHHHGDSTSHRQTQNDSIKTHADQWLHSVVESKRPQKIFRRHIILLILSGCIALLFLLRRK